MESMEILNEEEYKLQILNRYKFLHLEIREWWITKNTGILIERNDYKYYINVETFVFRNYRFELFYDKSWKVWKY